MNKLELNETVLNLKESSTLAINQKALQLRKENKTVYHWGFGQSPFPVPLEIQTELKNRTNHKEYLPTEGLLELRQVIVNFYKTHLDLEYSEKNILVGPGSKELLYQILFLLKGTVYIPAPSWVSYAPQVHITGARPSYITTLEENKYKLTPELLEESIKNQSGQKILILNSPSNPTGQVYTDQELKELTVILKKYDVLVISDEIYSQVNFTDEFSPSIAKHYKEKTIITNGLSKAYSAGGYRLGIMLIPTELEEIMKPFKTLISETYSAVAAPIQYASVKAWEYSEEVKDELHLCSQIHKVCAEYFSKQLSALNISAPIAQGGFYMFINFDHYKEKLGVSTSEELCHMLLKEAQIALLPGSEFYYPKKSLTARLAYVDYNGEDILAKAMDAKVIDENFFHENFSHMIEGIEKLKEFLNKYE